MKYWYLILVIAFAVLAGSASDAVDTLMWQVGAPDNSYNEFGIAGHCEKYTSEFPNGATYEVGKADPAKNWAYIQPGPSDAWAGSQEHPFEVVFFFDEKPEGTYKLTVDLVDVHSLLIPVLRVRVNDKIRTFELQRGVSDKSLTDPSNGREQLLTFYVGAGFFQKGRNVVNLTVTKGSWVLYDCITLSKCEQAPEPVDDLSLSSSCLFKTMDGKLKQVVEIGVDLNTDFDEMVAEISSEEFGTLSKTFRNVESGRQRLEFEVPPIKAEHSAELKLEANNRVFDAKGTLRPEKQWKVYLMPSTHFDYGYTSIQDGAMRQNRDNLQRAMDWCGTYPDFIWNLESSMVAQDYLTQGADRDRFVKLAKDKRIGVMGFYANFLTGLCSSEELSRLIGYYDFLRHDYGIESKCVMQNDVPTMVGTVPMILAGHGIKYLSHGINMTRAGGGQKLDRYPYYWESPDGSRVLVWKIIGGYAQSAELTGLDDSGHIGLARDRVKSLISEFKARKDYPFDAILMHGAYGDNYPNGISLAQVPEEWNKTYASPQMIFCRGEEFFEYIEANYADKIATVKGDGGVYWEDGAGSSARETGITRVAKERLITAEKLASLSDQAFRNKVTDSLADAWRNILLYDEHTWGAAGSMDAPYSKATLEQWAVKKSFADNAGKLSEQVMEESFKHFCSTIQTADDSVLVFNPSGWVRSERVSFVDGSGQQLSVFAESVPPLGYKLMPIKHAEPAIVKPLEEGNLDNEYYTIKFDKATGTVSSIYDKELKRELVDNSTYGLNSYLYATGESGSLLGYSDLAPKLDIATTTKPAFKKTSIPGKQVMSIECTAPNSSKPMTIEVILYENQKRIDFINNLDKDANLAKEAGYFAFPFAFKNPDVRLEIPDGVIRPEIDQFPGACKDWYCVQHFLTISDDSAAVVWSALDSPLVTLQDINRGQWYKHFDMKNGNVFAYVFNNYWWTNYKASQEGPHQFRFSLTSARKVSDMQAKQFGESVNNPLLCSYVEKGASKIEQPSKSFVSIDESNIVLQAIKPAKFSTGVFITLREMNGITGSATLHVAGIDAKRAYLCNLAEDKIKELRMDKNAIKVPCKSLGLASILLEQ